MERNSKADRLSSELWVSCGKLNNIHIILQYFVEIELSRSSPHHDHIMSGNPTEIAVHPPFKAFGVYTTDENGNISFNATTRELPTVSN